MVLKFGIWEIILYFLSLITIQMWKGLSKINLGVSISTLWSCRRSISFQNLTNWFLSKLGSGFKYMTSRSILCQKRWPRVFAKSLEKSEGRLNPQMMTEENLFGFVF